MNESIEISFCDSRRDFSPLEWLEGDVSYAFSKAQKRLEIRLLWFTQGKGTTDSGIVQSQEIEPAHVQTGLGLTSGSESFRFRLPDAPHSFSGQLISLIWAVEVEAFPSKFAVQREFVLAPNATEIALVRVETPISQTLANFQERKTIFSKQKNAPSPFEAQSNGPWSS